MDQLVCLHDYLDHVFASGATNHDAPTNSKIFDPQPVEGKLINAMGTVEERNTFGHGFSLLHCETTGGL